MLAIVLTILQLIMLVILFLLQHSEAKSSEHIIKKTGRTDKGSLRPELLAVKQERGTQRRDKRPSGGKKWILLRHR